MNRRKFISITGISAAALTLPAVGLYAKSLHEAASGIIYREFDYLQLDKGGVDQYVAEYLQKNPYDLSYELKMKAFDLLGFRSDKSTIITQLVQNYLSSTDFFTNKMDETKIVHYLGAYNPYTTPCANPFSYRYYPLETAKK